MIAALHTERVLIWMVKFNIQEEASIEGESTNHCRENNVASLAVVIAAMDIAKKYIYAADKNSDFLDTLEDLNKQIEMIHITNANKMQK